MKHYTIIEKTYSKLLDKIIDEVGDDLEDVLVQVSTVTGETIRFSWKDRDNRLEERGGY